MLTRLTESSTFVTGRTAAPGVKDCPKAAILLVTTKCLFQVIRYESHFPRKTSCNIHYSYFLVHKSICKLFLSNIRKNNAKITIKTHHG